MAVDMTQIEQKYIDKINNLSDVDLVDVWKKTYSKAKSFKKKSKQYEYYMNIANYMLQVHNNNLLKKQQIDTPPHK